MNADNLMFSEKDSLTLQELEYEKELLGLNGPGILLSQLSDKERLDWILHNDKEE